MPLRAFGFRAGERKPPHDRFRRDAEGIAQREHRDQRRLSSAALEQRYERLIEAAVERELGLRKPAFLSQLSEQPAECGAEPIGIFHIRPAWPLRTRRPKTIVFRRKLPDLEVLSRCKPLRAAAITAPSEAESSR